MKARNENGTILIYGNIPENYSSPTLGLVLGFDKLSNATHKAEGFYNVVAPDYDPYTQELGPIFWNETEKVFTYTVLTLAVPVPIPEVPLSMYAFLQRFTKAERKAIRSNCKTDDDLEDDWDMVMRMNQISRTNNKVTNLIATLVTKTILTSERALEVMQ